MITYRLSSGLFHLFDFKTVLDVLSDRAPGKEGVALEYDAPVQGRARYPPSVYEDLS